MLTRLNQSRQILLTLWFLAYFIWVQPFILDRLAQAPNEKNIVLGLLLIGVQIFELLGVWLKYPSVLARVEANHSQSWTQLVSFLLVLTHMMITALLAFSTLKLFGIELSGSQPFWPSISALVFFFAMLAKEGIFLSWWFGLMRVKITQLPPNQKMISPVLAEFIGDGLLAIFSALAYTVVWEQTVANSFAIRSVFIPQLLDYSGAVLFFLMVFPATRVLYYIEELLTQQPRVNVLVSWILLLMTMFAALLAIPKV